MQLLPRRVAPYVYGVLQAAITTGIATFIAALSFADAEHSLLQAWLRPWLLAWLTMLPVVLMIAPLIQRAVLWLTYDDRVPTVARNPSARNH